MFGYNGLGRITGNEAGSVVPGGGQGGTGMWGATGITRLFNDSFGAQASWLIPAALLALAVGLIWTLRRPRTDRTRGALLLWGGWLVVTGLVFSLSKGIIHQYYTVALAPAIGALVGIGAVEAWRRRDNPVARNTLALGVSLSAGWAFVLLARTPNWYPWLQWLILVAGIGAAVVLLSGSQLVTRTAPRWAVIPMAVLLLAVTLAGPTAYALNTAATAHTGSIPTAGPGTADGPGAGGPGVGGPGVGGPGVGGPGAPAGSVTDGATNAPTLPGGTASDGNAAANGNAAPNGNAAGGAASGPGSLLEGSSPGESLTALLEEDSSSYDWVAATVGANQAAGYQLATGDPVMPIGGFNGSDPSPTLAQFQSHVADGQIHWFISGGGNRPGGMGGPGGSSNETTSEISEWVQQTFTSRTVDGITIYDLTSPVS